MHNVFPLLLSGLFSVDRLTAMHLMLSRPIVVSSIIGLIHGDILTCLFAGVLFEIIGLVDVPVGTHIPRDDTFGAYAFSLLILHEGVETYGEFFVGMLLTLILMVPITYTEKLLRKWNRALLMKNMHGVAVFPAGKLLGYGVLLAFLRGVVFYNLGYIVLHAFFQYLHPLLPMQNSVEKYYVLTITFLTAFLLRFLSVRTMKKYAVFVLGMVLGWLTL